MAKLTNQKQRGVKIYDMITDNGEKKLLSITHKLGIDRFAYEAKNKWNMTFYDTPDNLLTKTGVLLYRTVENDKHYFKIEKLAFLPTIARLRKSEIFMLDVAPKDRLQDQSFYLVNGIQEMFSTQFSIDLENVIRAAKPKLKIDIKGTAYKGFRGDGFKCQVEFQKVIYKNMVTKRKHKAKEFTITQTSGKSFDDEFVGFLKTLEKYCKDILPHKESRYDIGMHMTTIVKTAPKVDRKAEKEKKKKEKKLSAENRIED